MSQFFVECKDHPLVACDCALRRDPRVRSMIVAALIIAEKEFDDWTTERDWESTELPERSSPEAIVDRVMNQGPSSSARPDVEERRTPGP